MAVFKIFDLHSAVKQSAKEIWFRLLSAIANFNMRFIHLVVRTHVNLEDDFIFDEKKASSRGRSAPDGKTYSSGYEINLDSVPDALKREVRNFDSVLRLYFGGEYLVNTATVWRNLGLPESYRALDIYSQIWHYDHVVDYRNVQLMVLLTDTTDDHGPFEYIEKPSVTTLLGNAAARNGVEAINGKVVKLTGVRGDGLWFATGSMPHRAGVPNSGKHRDMVSVAFFPKYTGIGIPPNAFFGNC
jgi:hypothetical protein